MKFKKIKDEIKLKRDDPKNLKYGGKNGQIYCNGEILFSTPICFALLGWKFEEIGWKSEKLGWKNLRMQEVNKD